MKVIKYISGDKHIEDVKLLFNEYSQIQGAEVCFVSFEKELANLSKVYAAPQGKILIAYEAENPVGCVAVKQIDDEACEMKRLYVKPTHRKQGIAKELIENAMMFARAAGYKKLVLETLPDVMANAIQLYLSVGFQINEDASGILKMYIML